MSAAPGWYPLANEPGTMGYWDGTGWTAHKQPLPPGRDSAPISAQEPSTGQASPAAGQWTPEGLFEGVKRTVLNKNNQAVGTAVAGGALIADGAVGIGQNRGGIGSAVTMMFIGVAFLAVGSSVVGETKASNTVHAGEIKATAVVRDISWSSPSGVSGSKSSNETCKPNVVATVNGEEYTTTSSFSASPCPWHAGDSVKVIYDPEHVDSTIRMDQSDGWALLPLLFPATGALMLIGGIWTFIKRAGSIAAGIFLLTKGLKDRRALKASAGA